MRSSGRWKKCGKPRATEGNDARRGEVCGANQRLSERVVKRVSAVAACRLGRASKQASQPVDQSINRPVCLLLSVNGGSFRWLSIHSEARVRNEDTGSIRLSLAEASEWGT